ncbi:MAG: T9SS type A sorting domain-containing protein [Bacteroidetes bacterium]|nr:T9SS type A sorting domain-containing protein [Bacteroidota bacterium]
MHLRTTFSALFIFTLFFVAHAQEPQPEQYKRVKINGSGAAFVNKLAETGVDLRCGVVFSDTDVQLELSTHELAAVEAAGLGYQVIIEDLTAFYAERAQRMLPFAKRNLEIEKQFSRLQRAQTTQGASAVQALDREITEALLNNVAQPETLVQEIDWAVPQNFSLGSMGGMLTVSELEAELDKMRALFPNLITAKAPLSTTETTWGGRNVWYVKISDNPDTDENEPETLMTSAIHARESASLMNNMFFMWYLLENYATDPFVKNIVDNSEMYFIPMVNPDGVARNQTISATGGGMQRKNLRNVCAGPTSSTQGVDLNRNFDYWYAFPGGSSTNICSDSYRGPNAFSEPESRMLRDFVLARQFKTVQMHHSFANSIPHPYGGNPTAVSGREAEYHKFHEDMTQYNRYIFGATVFSPAAGIVDDWMLGGAPDNNGRTGSGLAILGTTPESGSRSGSEGGFWPDPALLDDIAKRAMRINFINVLYAMKFAVLHDLTPTHVSTQTVDLKFGIERLGQTPGNFTLTVTPVSLDKIVSVTQPATQTAMAVLEQRNVSASMQLAANVIPGDTIQFVVKLSNEDHDLYEADIIKIFGANRLFFDDAESGNVNNWASSGGSWVSTAADKFNGNRAFSDANTLAYGTNLSKILRLNTSLNLTPDPGNELVSAMVQFYTRWDLERNFDFVEFQASTNGSTWVPVQGIYNKPATIFNSNDHAGKNTTNENFQPNNGTLLYDGDRMGKWVLEQFLINTSHNSFLYNQPNVQFRFVFRSDGTNLGENYPTQFDGFFFDDFQVFKDQKPTLSNDDFIAEQGLKIFPNPFVDQIQIEWSSLVGKSFSAALYDLQGRLIVKQSFDQNSSQLSIGVSTLSNGLYLLKLESEDGKIFNQKMIKHQ